MIQVLSGHHVVLHNNYKDSVDNCTLTPLLFCALMHSPGLLSDFSSSPHQTSKGWRRIHIQLPDDWHADNQPRRKDEWCSGCEWDGAWRNLLHRPPTSDEPHAGGGERHRCYDRALLWDSADRGNLCCAVLLAFLYRFENRARSNYGVQLNLEAWFANGGISSIIVEPPDSGYEMACRIWIPMSLPHNTDGITSIGDEILRSRWLFSPNESGSTGNLPPGLVSLPESVFKSISNSFGSWPKDSTLLWAKRRIDECQRIHDRCKTSHVGFLPTRLLHIPPNFKRKGVVLRLKDSISQGTPYTALSHCWGPENSWPGCLTTPETYNQQLSGIPWKHVPKTFADAIAITRKLGWEYIWIDSLCIIQKDQADWKAESVTMHQVYSNAVVTLAAADSPDSRGGLWFGQEWLKPTPLLTFSWGGETNTLFSFKEPLNPAWEVVHGVRSGNSSESSPLLMRAWAFQERLVSPRTLFFGKGRLVWDCCTKSELQPDLFLHALNVVDILDLVKRRGPKQIFSACLTATAPTSRFREWHKIVSEYSGLQLSVPTDKLPGIAAIAESFQASRPDDEYVCGLWSLTLVHDLLWERKVIIQYDGMRVPSSGEEGYVGFYDLFLLESLDEWPYTGPSWSWSSSFAAITYSSETITTSQLQVLDRRVIFLDQSPFGRVSPGSYLAIRAPTLDGSWKPAPMHSCLLRIYGQRQEELGEVYFALDWQKWRKWDRDTRADAVLVLVGTTESGCARALVLHQFPGTKNYKRIGILVSPGSPKFNETCKSLPGIFEKAGNVRTSVLE